MWVRCITSPRARRLGSKSSSDAADSTLDRVAAATGCWLPERTRDAVVMETPARAATSAREVRRVERPDIGIQVRYPDPASDPPRHGKRLPLRCVADPQLVGAADAPGLHRAPGGS